MGTLAVSANVAESMPLSMGEMVEDEPSFTPTEPAKKIGSTVPESKTNFSRSCTKL
jgi:hypothetical protein